MTKSQSRRHTKLAGKYTRQFQITERNKARRKATLARKVTRASLTKGHGTRHALRKARRLTSGKTKG